jgi:hypothetical protein
MRRFSMSRLIHGIALNTSGSERLAETKQHFFRAGGSMSQERNGMRAGRRGEKSKRGCVRACFENLIFLTPRLGRSLALPQAPR